MDFYQNKNCEKGGKFINTNKHILLYCTRLPEDIWENNHCVFVRKQSGDLYDCVNSLGDYNLYPTVPVNGPENKLWMVPAEWKFAEKC